jgi:hypothetical protein
MSDKKIGSKFVLFICIREINITIQGGSFFFRAVGRLKKTEGP